ncbi:CinA family protein [Zhihengliuella alba]|uniref:CinA family protein n=1 Tax=Zhihengliuella alba TaxID=547018 RepID=UPI003CD05FDF
MPADEGAGLAAAIVASGTERGLTVATAESLTAGLVAAAIADVPGSSAVLRGGVVSYHNEVKAGLLDVPEGLLAERGSVDPEVARRMAVGARRACGADVGVSTTGVAGPAAHDGKPVGTVYIGWADAEASGVVELDASGTRPEIRRAACEAALAALAERVVKRTVA